jgi:hypothetical protein
LVGQGFNGARWTLNHRLRRPIALHVDGIAFAGGAILWIGDCGAFVCMCRGDRARQGGDSQDGGCGCKDDVSHCLVIPVPWPCELRCNLGTRPHWGLSLPASTHSRRWAMCSDRAAPPAPFRSRRPKIVRLGCSRRMPGKPVLPCRQSQDPLAYMVLGPLAPSGPTPPESLMLGLRRMLLR